MEPLEPPGPPWADSWGSKAGHEQALPGSSAQVHHDAPPHALLAWPLGGGPSSSTQRPETSSVLRPAVSSLRGKGQVRVSSSLYLETRTEEKHTLIASPEERHLTRPRADRQEGDRQEGDHQEGDRQEGAWFVELQLRRGERAPYKPRGSVDRARGTPVARIRGGSNSHLPHTILTCTPAPLPSGSDAPPRDCPRGPTSPRTSATSAGRRGKSPGTVARPLWSAFLLRDLHGGAVICSST